MKWLIGIAALAIGLGVAPAAHADLHDLTHAEIAEGDYYHPAYCGSLDEDPRPITVRAIITVIQGHGFDHDGAINVIEHTIHTYCPQHLMLKSQTLGGPVD